MFLYGNPVPPDQFIGRRRELKQIAGRIAYHGQSTAVIGEPRIGKTSLLEYLKSPAGRDKIQSLTSTCLVFVYLDAHALDDGFDHAQFWAHVLDPILTADIPPAAGAAIMAAYGSCQDKGFKTHAIESLFTRIHEAGVRLVVLIDEFDHLVHHFRSADSRFSFGALRSLATRSRGALALVVTSRRPTVILDEIVQQYGYTGSPLFNFVSEVRLGPLSEQDVDALLARARDRFSADDQRYIHEVSGGHPFLVQVAADALWTAHESGDADPQARRSTAGSVLYREAARMLGDMWRHWPAAMRYVFTAITVEHLDALGGWFGLGIPGQSSPYEQLADINASADELDVLKEYGVIMPDPATPSGWRVRPVVFLAWCAAQLRMNSASTQNWERWLRQQGFDAFLSHQQWRTWTDVIRARLPRAVPKENPLVVAGVDLSHPPPSRRPSPRSPRAAGSSVAPPSSRRHKHRLFYSYSHADESMRNRLEKHLKPLERQGLIAPWNDRAILPGSEWSNEIASELEQADVILLLISADFLDSDYIWGVEMKRALERQAAGQAKVIPILLRPCDWTSAPFARLQALPQHARPVSQWPDQDEAWANIAAELRKLLTR